MTAAYIEKKRLRRAIGKIYAGFLGIGGLFYLLVGPLGVEIPCFYRATTGLLCPGCGSSRMFLSLIKLDFIGAFSLNPVVFCLFFGWNLVAALGLWGKPVWLRRPPVLWGLLWASVGLLLIFGLLRNIG